MPAALLDAVFGTDPVGVLVANPLGQNDVDGLYADFEQRPLNDLLLDVLSPALLG